MDRQALHRDVRVGKTPYGRGIFARRQLATGEVLGEVRGKLVYDPDYGSSYCIDVGDEISLEPVAPFRLLNHCCEPNCEFFRVFEPPQADDGLTPRTDGGQSSRPPQVFVRVLRDVEPGAQLTIDYAWCADQAIRCACGSANCRGWIVAAEELPLLLRQQRRRAARAPRV